MLSVTKLSYVQPCQDVELIILQESERSENEIGILLVARQTYDNPTLLYTFFAVDIFFPITFFFPFQIGFLFWKETC